MNKPIIDKQIVHDVLASNRIEVPGKGSIREIVKIVNDIEKKSGIRFIRMEMGVPGLDPCAIGTEAEIKALKRGVASKYPMIEGLQILKNEISRKMMLGYLVIILIFLFVLIFFTP